MVWLIRVGWTSKSFRPIGTTRLGSRLPHAVPSLAQGNGQLHFHIAGTVVELDDVDVVPVTRSWR